MDMLYSHLVKPLSTSGFKGIDFLEYVLAYSIKVDYDYMIFKPKIYVILLSVNRNQNCFI